MKMFLQYLLWFCLVSAIYCGCAQQSSCEECTNLSACYWCDSSNRCQDYYGEKFSGLLCPNQWVQHRSLCTTNENTDTSRILNIIKHMKNYDTRPMILSSSLTGNSRYNPPVQPSQQKNSNAADAELKELLRKLMLLKLLRKMKTKGSSSLTSEDRELLSQLTHEKLNLNSIAVPATATITTTTKSPNVNNKIKHLLSVLEQKAKTNKTPIASISKLPTIKSPAVENSNKNITRTSENTLKPTDSVLSLLRKVDEQNAGIVYEENKNIGFPRPSVVSTSPPSSVKITDNTTLRPSLDNFTVKTTTSVPGQSVVNYCKLYEEVYICNSDSNCTWCNTRDICIKRSGVEYKACVAAKDQMVDKEFGLDKCLAKKHCKECVENDKCYWCDVSKSCHTYPFLGYVPQTCGGDWYVKQCDVQLAVILIVLPLIIILLAMVTFYFCLKYCYYRRKVLRVPLFEKPGVFDYRKDKKVYYVNPEDESSDTEMAAEKIRKKYRLPVEREPLIDPNS